MPFSLRVRALTAVVTQALALGGGPPSPAGCGFVLGAAGAREKSEQLENNFLLSFSPSPTHAGA